MPYFAATLTEESHKKILQQFRDHIDSRSKKLAHHVTIIPPPEFRKNDPLLRFEGKKVQFKVDAIGTWRSGVLALRVHPKDFLAQIRKNGIAHLTLAINSGYSPKDSNNITNWKLLNVPILLDAVFTIEQ